MPDAKRFNAYILKSVAMIEATRANLGYDIGCYFTRNLDYGGCGTIPANHPPKTMCVAAMCEVIVEALNLWQQDHTDAAGHADKTPFLELPVKSWTGGSPADIRAHIFMYGGVNSRGTANALARFGIGGETSLDQLQPGDFVNFNRSRSGHAAVFLSFIDDNFNDAPYSPNVTGFRYFSSQGQAASAPNHGFGYRWGVFADSHPSAPPAGVVADYGIRRSPNLAIFDCGYMADPSQWNVASAIAKLQADFAAEIAVRHNLVPGGPVSQSFSGPNLTDNIVRNLADQLFNAPLSEPDWSWFDDSRG